MREREKEREKEKEATIINSGIRKHSNKCCSIIFFFKGGANVEVGKEKLNLTVRSTLLTNWK